MVAALPFRRRTRAMFFLSLLKLALACALCAVTVSAQISSLVWNASVVNSNMAFDNSGVVYVEEFGLVCFNSRVDATCLNAATGVVAWTASLNSVASYDTYPAHRNGTLIVVGASVMAFNVQTGALLWSTALSSPPSFWSATIYDASHRVYVTTQTGAAALEFVTGGIIWESTVPITMQNRTVGPPAVSGTGSSDTVVVNAFGNIATFTGGVYNDYTQGPGGGDAWNELLYVCNNVIATWQTENQVEIYQEEYGVNAEISLAGYPYAGSVADPGNNGYSTCGFVTADGSGEMQYFSIANGEAASPTVLWTANFQQQMQYWAEPVFVGASSIVVASSAFIAVINPNDAGNITGMSYNEPQLAYVERSAAVNSQGTVVYVGAEGQVLAYTLPTQPPPTQPPTPPPYTPSPYTPAPTAGTIEVEWCVDGQCQQCGQMLYYQAGCSALGAAASVNRTCYTESNLVEVTEYTNSIDCTGDNSGPTSYYFENCYVDPSGMSFEYQGCY
jgi:hypothetical protein